MNKKKNIGKALTWGDIADIYNKTYPGRNAKLMSLDDVSDWVEFHKEKFWFDPDKETFHEIKENKNEQV